jgi:serine/threonine protein kinase
MDMDLRNYLQQNHNKLTWKERINIIFYVIRALLDIHEENAIHRDLHSGNILSSNQKVFRISDLGFCGPADKPLNSVYGNLPYIAPEVIAKKETTFASDIYSIGMLMWEISSGQPPFINYKHDYYLAMKITNGMRPKIVPGTPLEYKELMEQCWDANLTKRPNIKDLDRKVSEMLLKSYHLNENKEQQTNNDNANSINYYTNSGSDNSLVWNFSKIHIFDDYLPEPRNATEGKVIKYF